MRAEAKHSMVLFLGTGVTAGLSMVYAAFIARMLGPARNADYAAAISFVFMCAVVMGSINPTVARFTAEYKGRGEYGRILTLTREVGRRVLLYGAAAMVIGLLVVKPLAEFFRFHSVLPLVIAFFIVYFSLPLSVARGVLRGAQEFGKLNVNGILEAAFRLAIGAVLVTWVARAATALAAYALAMAAVLVVSRWQLRRVWVGHAAQTLDGAAVRRFTGPALFMIAAAAGFQNLDMLFVKRFFVDYDAGVYAAAATFARMIGVVVTPFSILMLPMLTTLHERGERTTGAFLRVCGYFLGLVAGPLIIVAIWPEEVMVRIFGEEYAGGGRILLSLSLARLAGYLCHLICLLFAAKSSFRFLFVYLPGLMAMVGGLLIWHDTALTVAGVVLFTQIATLLAMIVYLLVQRGSRASGSRDASPGA